MMQVFTEFLLVIIWSLYYECDSGRFTIELCGNEAIGALCARGTIVKIEDVEVGQPHCHKSCTKGYQPQTLPSMSELDPRQLVNIQLGCNGRQACEGVTFSPVENYRNPCENGHKTSIFKRIHYQCLPVEEQAIGCSREIIRGFVCPINGTISIKYVVYGAFCTFNKYKICTYDQTEQEYIQYADTDSLDSIRRECDGLEWCSTNVTIPRIADDICQGEEREGSLVTVYFGCGEENETTTVYETTASSSPDWMIVTLLLVIAIIIITIIISLVFLCHCPVKSTANNLPTCEYNKKHQNAA